MAQSTPLYGQSNRAAIGPDRLFVASQETQSEPDFGVGAGFIPIGRAVLVAQGPSLSVVTPLAFRLLTTWGDAPDAYEGTMGFTALVKP